jgi:hypothetical protein
LISDSDVPPAVTLQQAVFQTNPVAIPKIGHKAAKAPRPEKRESKPSLHTNLNLPAPAILPPAYVPIGYKPPPIESFTEPGPTKPPRQLPLEVPLTGEPRKHGVRAEMERLSRALDSAIASIAPNLANATTAEEFAAIRVQLLQVHIYTLNQVILLEKDHCSEKSLLLRKIEKFYHKLLDEIPAMREKFEGEIAELVRQIEQLKAELAEQTQAPVEAKQRESVLKQSEATLIEQLATATEGSSARDVELQKAKEDRDYCQGLLQQATYKLGSKEQDVCHLNEAITHATTR